MIVIVNIPHTPLLLKWSLECASGLLDCEQGCMCVSFAAINSVAHLISSQFFFWLVFFMQNLLFKIGIFYGRTPLTGLCAAQQQLFAAKISVSRICFDVYTVHTKYMHGQKWPK